MDSGDLMVAWLGLLLGLSGSGFIFAAVIRFVGSVRGGLR